MSEAWIFDATKRFVVVVVVVTVWLFNVTFSFDGDLRVFNCLSVVLIKLLSLAVLVVSLDANLSLLSTPMSPSFVTAAWRVNFSISVTGKLNWKFLSPNVAVNAFFTKCDLEAAAAPLFDAAFLLLSGLLSTNWIERLPEEVEEEEEMRRCKMQ